MSIELDRIRNLSIPKIVESNIELKPCPFCGSKTKVRLVVYRADGELRYSDKYAVQCEYTGNKRGCGAEGQQNKFKDEAVYAWNRRNLKTTDGI